MVDISFDGSEAFEKFLVSNNIISTTAGVLVAYSTWDLIQSLVGDVVLPGLYFLLVGPDAPGETFVSQVFEPVSKLNLPKFACRALSFLIVLLVTFVTIQYLIAVLGEGADSSSGGGGGDVKKSRQQQDAQDKVSKVRGK